MIKKITMTTQTTSAYQANLSRQLATLSPAKRSLLELRLRRKNGHNPAPRALAPQPLNQDEAPLSYNQQGLWLLNQLTPGTSLYHTPIAVRLKGELNVGALRDALNATVARHSVLRTTFIAAEGSPRQRVAKSLVLDLPIIDLRELASADRESEAQRVLRTESDRPFDLSIGPLVRAVLLRLADRENILLVTMHHIVTDGWSVGIFQRELSLLYNALVDGNSVTLPELPLQYTDFSVWQREWFEGDVYQSQLAYWKTQFQTLPPPLELRSDHARRPEQGFRGAQHTITLSKPFTRDLKHLCQKQNVTLYMMLLAAFNVLLHRYTGEEDIVVGTPIAGRQLAEIENLIGLFINTLALRTAVAGDLPFQELLKRVKQVALGAYAHQDLPFERLVKELQPERSFCRNPLFQVMFVLQTEDIQPLRLRGLEAEHFRIGNIRANFDLTLDIVERDEELVCLFESNADIFEPETIQRMMGHFRTLLEAIVLNPQQKISDLPMLSDAERRTLLVDWNNTKTNYPANRCIQELFEEQARETPEAIALVSENQEISYRELNAEANRLAHYLRRRGIRPNMRVAVCMQRSPKMIAALLGILKAGGAYVPLDADYPKARLEFMLADARASAIITERRLLAELPANVAEIICLDEISAELSSESSQNPQLNTNADDLAYVIYTSGSTGKPKGVAVRHRNVVRLVRNTNYANFSADEVFLQYAPVSFDASTFEIWGSLLNGARLALMPAGKASLKQLADALKSYQVTTLWLTAGLFHLMVDNHLDDLRGLRQLLAGGDVLSVPHVRKFCEELPSCRLINGYGPTENTTFTTYFPVDDLNRVNGSVPIGYPISNTSVYVLDRYLNPAPIGVPGELYIGGDGLAHGYLDRPELNAERFVRNHFSSESGARLYKTGDLVRYRPTGEIEFIGRVDNQVKVRGFRIELGEVEAALSDCPGVREAVVIARKDEGDKHLVAYVTGFEGSELSTDEIRKSLQQKLPDYMMPSQFAVLEKLPLTPVGKVDRNALPAANTLAEPERNFAAPGDELELKLAKIWEKILKVQSVGIDDNFFDLGGHSLLAVKLFAQIEKSFGKNLPLATLFEAPTVKQLAGVLRKQGWQPAWSSLVMMQGGSRQPFFCIHAAGGNVLEYHDLALLLGTDRPVYGLQAKGLDGKSEPHTSIPEMAAHYIREMREVQPDGPYMIGGRSSGGTIAFEMACQLVAQGQPVSLVALLDTYPAGYFKLLPDSRSLRQKLTRSIRKLHTHASNLRELPTRQRLAYIRNKLAYAPQKVKHKLYRSAYRLYKKLGQPLPAVLKNIEEINFAAVKDYVPRPYDGDIALFLASDLTSDYDLHDGWRELVRGEIETHEIPGNHINIIKPPHVEALATQLRYCIERASEVTAGDE